MFIVSVFLSLQYRGMKEVAWSQYRMWEAVGLLFIYLLGHYFCLGVSLLAAMTCLCLSLCCYIALQIKVKLKEHEQGRTPPHDKSLVLPEMTDPSWLPGLNPHTSREKSVIAGHEGRLFAADLETLAD